MTTRTRKSDPTKGIVKSARMKIDNPQWVQDLIDTLRQSETNAWMGDMLDYFSQGYTNPMVYKYIGRTHSSITALRQANKEFAELVEMGEALSKAYWEEVGQKGVFDPKAVSFPMYAFYMKNKFGWSEKYETTDKSSPVAMSTDQLQAEILAKVNRLQNKLIGMDENKALGYQQV